MKMNEIQKDNKSVNKKLKLAGISPRCYTLKLGQFGDVGEKIRGEILSGGLSSNYIVTGDYRDLLCNSVIRALCVSNKNNNSHVLSINSVKGLKGVLSGKDVTRYHWGAANSLLESVAAYNKNLYIRGFISDSVMSFMGSSEEQYFIEDYLYKRVQDESCKTLLGSVLGKSEMLVNNQLSEDFRKTVISDFVEIEVDTFSPE